MHRPQTLSVPISTRAGIETALKELPLGSPKELGVGLQACLQWESY